MKILVNLQNLLKNLSKMRNTIDAYCEMLLKNLIKKRIDHVETFEVVAAHDGGGADSMR